MTFKIAVAQFQITHQQRDVNFQRIEGFIRRAAKQGAQVIVFPEDCVTGSIFGDLSKLDRGQTNLAVWRQLAARYQIDVVTGSTMEATADGNYNTSYYVDATGEVLGTYRKNHLYPSEYKFLKPGTEAPVFETKYGRAAIVICWDMLFSGIFERLRAQNVQIIYCPSYWYQEIAEPLSARNPHSESQLLDAMCLTRAVEANAALVYCNAAGVMVNPDGSADTLIGHSQIVLPVLGTGKWLAHNREAMFIHEVSLETLGESARIYRTR